MADQSHLAIHAPHSEKNKKLLEILASPSFQTLDPVYKDTATWRTGKDYDRIMGKVGLVSQLRDTPQFKRAAREKYVSDQDLASWRALLAANAAKGDLDEVAKEVLARLNGTASWDQALAVGKTP
jgi:hypothetical protein